MAGNRTDKVIVVVWSGSEKDRRYWLITSTVDKGRWGLIKGSVERGKTDRQVAREEAFEEAGLHVRRLSKLKGKLTTPDGKRATVWYGRIDKTLKPRKWPEGHERKRQALSYSHAMHRLRRKGGRWSEMMRNALRRVHKS